MFQRSSRAAPFRALVHVSVRVALILLLLLALGHQLTDFLAQPVSTSIGQTPAPFPRLTVCPGSSLQDDQVLLDRLRQLKAGSISIGEFYNHTTLELLGGHLFVEGSNPEHSAVSANDTGHGLWRPRFYMRQHAARVVWEMRCYTLEASAALRELAFSEVEMQLRLAVPLLFVSGRDIAYRLFIHGTEEPNIGDLFARQSAVRVPSSTFVELWPGEAKFFRVTASQRRIVNLRRRPCRSEPGYSPGRCMKACLWRRLAARINCRLPHMVGPDVHQPELHGPLDHLPLCKRPVRIQPEGGRRAPRRAKQSDGPLSAECLVESYENTRPSPNPDAPGTDNPSPASNTTSADLGNKINRTLEEAMLNEELVELMPAELLTHLSGCDCPRPCSETKYHISVDTRTDLIRHPVSACFTQAILKMDLLSDLTEESLSFSLSTLAANMAGLVGLITGVSLFSLSDAGEALVFAASGCWWGSCKSKEKHKSGGVKDDHLVRVAWESEQVQPRHELDSVSARVEESQVQQYEGGSASLEVDYRQIV